MKTCGECKWFRTLLKDAAFGQCAAPVTFHPLPACYHINKIEVPRDHNINCDFWVEKCD